MKILDGNAFKLRITCEQNVEDYKATTDMSKVESLLVNFVRRGRITQTSGVDSAGRIVASNSGNLAIGIYGVELTGYYNGAPWRFYADDVFEIINDENEVSESVIDEGVPIYDVTFTLSLGGSADISFVDSAIINHNDNEFAHGDIRRKLGDKIDDILVDDESVVETDPVTGRKEVKFDSDNFGKVDDVKVNGTSVVSQKVANIPVPTKTSDLQNDSDFVNESDMQSALDEKQDKIDTVNLDYQEDGGSPSASASFENGVLDISMKNMKMKFSELTAEEKAAITGAQGPQGDSAVYNPDDPDVPDFEMANTTGQSTTKAMTQKAVTDELDEINISGRIIDLNSLYTEPFYYYNGKWHSSQTINGKHICTRPGAKYRITTGERFAKIRMLATYTTPVDNASVSVTTMEVPANTTQIVTIPDGIYHLFIQNNSEIVAGSEQYPDEIFEIVSESINSSVSWVEDDALKNSLSGMELISKFTYKDLVIMDVMKIDGSVVHGSNSHFATSNYIQIPNNADVLRYNKVNGNYQDVNAGICLCDSNHTVIWYDVRQETVETPMLDGEINLKDYPNAVYVRFMPAVRTLDSCIEFYKIVDDNYSTLSSVIIGGDNAKAYGSMRQADSYNYSSSVKYVTSETPCEKDGIISYIYGRFTSGTCTLYIGHIDQNDYVIIRDSFQIAVTSGYNVIDISSRGIILKEGEYIFSTITGALPYFKTGAGTPSAFYIDQSGKVANFSSNTFQTLAWTVNSHVDSFNEMIDDVNEMKSEIHINSLDIEKLKNNKKYFIDDSVTGEHYQIVVNNGVLSLQNVDISKALVLGNSIAIHEITEFWWGEWGMAATKAEYDFAHILEEGLQNRNAEATVDVVQMRPWEQNFNISLDELIGDKLTAETQFVVIRVGGNVPEGNLSQFQSALESLIDYIRSVANGVRIAITGNFGVDVTRENAIIGAADAKRIDYVEISQFAIPAYKEAVGHYVYGDDGEIHEIDNSGVAWHPNNAGMLAIANALLEVVWYAPVQKSYSLQEVTVDGVTGTMYVEDE